MDAKPDPGKNALASQGGQFSDVNLLATQAGGKDSPAIKKSMAALHWRESKKFIHKRFKGSLVCAI